MPHSQVIVKQAEESAVKVFVTCASLHGLYVIPGFTMGFLDLLGATWPTFLHKVARLSCGCFSRSQGVPAQSCSRGRAMTRRRKLSHFGTKTSQLLQKDTFSAACPLKQPSNPGVDA